MNDDLFHPGTSTEAEILPLQGGTLRLWQRMQFNRPSAELLQLLINECSWKQEQITVYGKPYLQPRLSAWYGDAGYRYSGIELKPLPWTDTLLEIKSCIEQQCRHQFNSVLLNYYRDRDDSMGMHSDDEKELGAEPVIASLSLGETRNFLLRHKTRKDLDTIKLPLYDGSLLLMEGGTQRNWRHGIAKQKAACGPRINLTFRNIITAGSSR